MDRNWNSDYICNWGSVQQMVGTSMRKNYCWNHILLTKYTFCVLLLQDYSHLCTSPRQCIVLSDAVVFCRGTGETIEATHLKITLCLFLGSKATDKARCKCSLGGCEVPCEASSDKHPCSCAIVLVYHKFFASSQMVLFLQALDSWHRALNQKWLSRPGIFARACMRKASKIVRLLNPWS